MKYLIQFHLMASRKNILTFTWVDIDNGLNIRKKTWDSLNFIKYHGACVGIKKWSRISYCQISQVVILKTDIPMFRKTQSSESCFARLPWPGQGHDSILRG